MLLDARRDLADVFRQASYRFPAVRFVLDAVDSTEDPRDSSAACDPPGKSCNRVEADGGQSFPSMRKRDFDAISEAREGDLQVRRVSRQVFEGFPARSNDGRLPLRDGVIFHSCAIGKVAGDTADRGSQTDIRVELQVEAYKFSGHGFWRGRPRRLPGNPGNSRDRPCKGARCAALCKWCSIVHTCTVLPANRTERNW
jgi:hypothetical protein